MMKHRLVLIVIGLLIIGIVAFFYIDNIFLPFQLKRYITTHAEKHLHRKVSVETIDFRPIQGFIVKNLSVARKDDPNRPFLQIDEITFNLLLAPFLQKKAIILPSIRIKNPYIYLSRNEKGVWNFSDLRALKRNLKKRNSFSVFLRKLILIGGTVHYRDFSTDQEFFESIEHIQLRSTLSLNKGIRFIASAQVPKRKSKLKIKGNYGIPSKKLTSQILINNFYIARYLSLFYTSQPYIHLKDGVISSADFRLIYQKNNFHMEGSFLANKTNFQVGEDKNMNGVIHVPSMSLTWYGYKWNAKGLLKLPSFHMTSSDGKEFRGDMTAKLNLLTIFNNYMTSQGNVTVDNARFMFDKNKYFRGNIHADNAALVKQDGKILLRGNFDIDETAVAIDETFALKGDLATKQTKLIWSRDDMGTTKFEIKSGGSMDDAQVSFGTNRSAQTDINIRTASVSFDRTKMIVEALGQLSEANISFAENKKFTGNPFFNIFVEKDLQDRSPLDYKGTLRFTTGSFSGTPYVDTVKNLSGIAAIMPGHIQTDKLTFETKETAVELSGLLTNFSDPFLDVKASSEKVEFHNVLETFPSLKETIKGHIDGQASVQASYIGPLFSVNDAIIRASAQLTGATYDHEKLPQPLTDISGRLHYEKDLVRWNNLLAHYNGIPYTLNGRLSNFSRPTVETNVSAEHLKLDTKVKFLRSAFQVLSLVGTYLNSSFDLKGDAHLFEDASADLDIRGNLSLDLRDAGSLIPRIKHRLEPLNLSGILAGEGIYKGKLNDWRNWQLSLDLGSDQIRIKGFPLENVAIRVTQRDLTISKCNLTSKLYGGALMATSSADLRDEDVPFDIAIDLKGFDFAQYREDKKLKDRHLAGTLSLATDLKGSARQWRELTGEGSLDVVDGHLWQWNILSGMSKILLIPEFKNSVFTEGHCTFAVANQRFLTDDAKIISKFVTLDGKGWMDFDKNLNFDIKPTFSKLAIEQSKSSKKGPTSVITQTEGYLGIKLTGTLDKPKYFVEKRPLKIIKGTIGDTTDTIKGVLGDIVDGIF